MARADIEIIGAGIFGLSIAFECVRRGANVRVVDKRCIGAGASGGLLGALTPHAPDNWNAKKQFQFDCLCGAQRWWQEIEQIGGRSSGFARCGRLQPINGSRSLALAEKRVIAADQNWGHEFKYCVVNRGDFGPWAPLSDSGKLIYDSLSARLNPKMAIASLVAALAKLNCRIDEETDARHNSGLRILATGHEGLAQLSRELGQQLGGGEMGQAMLVDVRADGQPQIFGDNVHLVPHADGLAIGSTSERKFVEPVRPTRCLEQLQMRAEKLMPQIAGSRVLARWAGIRPRARTRLPILGQHPLEDGLYIANGGYKTGFAIASGVAHVMADMVLDGVHSGPNEFAIENQFADRQGGTAFREKIEQ